MKKTILEWFDELPEPVRSQAIENCVDIETTFKTETMHEAILAAFYWGDTKQGRDYWHRVFNQYVGKK